ncbi:hypothetical protein Rta_37950 [Ramlibacter tataouinensis TTB310]|uniref:DUF72 domain-containing protein n=1 Tax=Ramlibacter tataouinensis (strain ATCC BAA-407 / DSM 14655 / LMG 21543 / TTB310) TaxID=365046 RepID=F5Y331_RAMTT|nr:hypothetical protein Rta_37950 [Ramlibacter tataouinensis TTB310]
MNPAETASGGAGQGGRIHVGIGGWTYEPWRGGNFYPDGLPHAQELHHASRRLTAIEVNGTYYSTFKPATFARWRDETPEGFVFSLKATRFATHRRELAGAGDSIRRFVDSGIAELGDKLGPIVWQFMPTQVFDPWTSRPSWLCCRRRWATGPCATCSTCGTRASPRPITWRWRGAMAT